MQPFLDFQVAPTYGTFKALLRWQMMQGFGRGKFIVRRSPDGLNDWKTIGETESNFFIDEQAIPKIGEYYYQVIFIRTNERFDSPVVSTFGKISRKEFGAAYKIMSLEFQQLRQHTPVKIYKVRVSSPECTKCVDPDTGQQIGTTLCETCYGTGFEGGYWPAHDSFMKLLSIGPQVQLGSTDGTGSTNPLRTVARMLAYPPLMKDDLIVDPSSDKRYLVETVSIAYLNGKVPFVFDQVGLVYLRATDVRYKLPL